MSEVKVGDTTVKVPENTMTPAAFISYLFSVRTVLHILHLKTNSYATHKALNAAYDGILDITDGIAEKHSGSSGGHLTGFKDYPVARYENEQPDVYIKQVKSNIQRFRYIAFDKNYSPIQNELDNLTNLFDETLYLLTLK